MRIEKALFAVVSAALLAGCASTSITNLTPRTHQRNEQNVYPVEINFNSNLRAIRRDTIKPYVQIGNENYLMRQTSVVKDRWESLIPVSKDQKLINYRIKVDFDYNSIPEPSANSVLSVPYQIRILD
ncbi:MAG: hypothetical protein ISQ14_02975 [Verrucomicrobiae bacterium]|jgi:hypothetical protein|nr:hypothetical protein [Verrucomicrobiae bacterium]